MKRPTRRAINAYNLGFACGTLFGALVMFALIDYFAEVWL